MLNASSLPSMVLSRGICSTRCTPRSRQNNFQHASPLGCLPDPNGRTRFRLRVRSVSLRKFCVSNVDTLTLHFSFLFTVSGVPILGCLFTGSGVPIPGCWFTGSWVPIPGCFLLGFLGPIPGLFSFLFIIFQLIDLSSNSSSSSCPFFSRSH